MRKVAIMSDVYFEYRETIDEIKTLPNMEDGGVEFMVISAEGWIGNELLPTFCTSEQIDVLLCSDKAQLVSFESGHCTTVVSTKEDTPLLQKFVLAIDFIGDSISSIPLMSFVPQLPDISSGVPLGKLIVTKL